MEIKVEKDYQDPEGRSIEIVERKGIGHPDTLADKLAEELSRVYSIYCLKNFNCILHHNIDKLYIGGGLFVMKKNKITKINPIRVELNGRVSNTMNGKKIDLEKLFVPVIKEYLSTVIPRLNPETDLNIIINCTQYSKREFWYTPRNINDVPDSGKLFAADTALCVNHSTKTFCERLTFELEQSFWNYNEKGYASPKFSKIGQDIKVMVSRIHNDIVATVCMPVYKDVYSTHEEYNNIIKFHEARLTKIANHMNFDKKYNINIEINRLPDGAYRNYSLVVGSCIECGEEGIVGRGNNSQGLISSFREHTVEAPCGKNPRYHTGRIVNFLANNATSRIFEELGVKCTLYSLTRNRGSIIRPFLFYLSVDDLTKKEECIRIIKEEFDEKKFKGILNVRKLF